MSNNLEINGYKLIQTCSVYPEQYDVFKDDKLVGYLRLRNGYFSASYPDVDGICVLGVEVGGPGGMFLDKDRLPYLILAITAIDQEHRACSAFGQ